MPTTPPPNENAKVVPTPPPRDANGKVTPHDHEQILPDDWVIRRISELHLVEDPKVGGKKISSMAFNASTGHNGGMSVDLQKFIENSGQDAQAFVTTPNWIGSVRLKTGEIRNENFMVGYDPSKRNPYHGEVWGEFSSEKRDKLKEICEWFVPIPNVSIN